MVPRKIFNYTTSGGAAHLLHDLRMSMEMLQRRCDRIDITRPDDDAFDAVAHYIAGLTSGDLGQRARRGFVWHFGAAFPLRRKNMHRSLVQIILRVANKSHLSNVIAPELLQIRLRFVLHITYQPQLR